MTDQPSTDNGIAEMRAALLEIAAKAARVAEQAPDPSGDGEVGWARWGYLQAIEDLTRPETLDIMRQHLRLDIGPCTCGWQAWGKSHAAHVLGALESDLRRRMTRIGERP